MLTDAQVRKIKPLDKKKRYSDEKGLYLEVTPSGGRFWRLKYRFNGRESTLTIGGYPEISLAQARRARDEARLNLKDGINPNEAKKQKKLQVDESTLFRALAMEWMEDRKAVIKEATYLRDLSVCEKDLFPALNALPVYSTYWQSTTKVIFHLFFLKKSVKFTPRCRHSSVGRATDL